MTIPVLSLFVLKIFVYFFGKHALQAPADLLAICYHKEANSMYPTTNFMQR